MTKSATQAAEPGWQTRRFLGLEVQVAKRSEVIALLLGRLAERRRTLVTFANTNLVVTAARSRLSERLSRDFVILNDGIGLNLASLLCYGTAFPENLNGTDFTRTFLDDLPPRTAVYLFGSTSDVIERAGSKLASLPNVKVVGGSDGFQWREHPCELIRTINAANPDVLLVALGNPLQEEWILEHASRISAPITIAVGAFLDFTSGKVARAPRLVRMLRLEWAYRLLLEPGRLWRRYSIDLLWLFAALVLERFKEARRTAGQGGRTDRS